MKYFTLSDTSTVHVCCTRHPSPSTKNHKTHPRRQHTAVVVCETELRPHTNVTAAAPPSKPPQQGHHISTTTAAQLLNRGGSDQTSQATVYVPDFSTKDKRQNKTYQLKKKNTCHENWSYSLIDAPYFYCSSFWSLKTTKILARNNRSICSIMKLAEKDCYIL